MTNTLFPFQKAGVRRMITSTNNILLADEMGLGKTVQIAAYLDISQAFPALVVCPASLKINWSREIEKWTGHKAFILGGRFAYELSSQLLKNYPIVIINYDILGSELPEEKEAEAEREKKARENGLVYRRKLLKVHGWCDFLAQCEFKTIIADEVQYISERETLRARGLRQICEAIPSARRIFLSGTPYETKTSQFFTALNLIAPKTFPNRWFYLQRYCGAKQTHWGWTFNGLSNADELRSKLAPIMIRRLKMDVLTELPPKIRSVIPLDVSASDRAAYDEIEGDFSCAVDHGNKRTQLGFLAKLKAAAYKAKEKAAISWIKDYLAVNDAEKLVVFVYHHSAFDALMQTFSKIAVGVNGDTSIPNRQKAVDDFQNKSKIRLFVGQIKAAGVGLTLTKARATCFIEFGSTAPQHEQAEDRVHRIGQTADSVMAYYLVLEDSIEQDIMCSLQRRNADMKRVMNGETNAELFQEEELNEATLSEYKNRKNKKK